MTLYRITLFLPQFGWYTRRIGLATIMKMTELYMVQDTSPSHAQTWDFLKNRMDEAVQLQMALAQTEGMTQTFQRSFNSAFVTVCGNLNDIYLIDIFKSYSLAGAKHTWSGLQSSLVPAWLQIKESKSPKRKRVCYVDIFTKIYTYKASYIYLI